MASYTTLVNVDAEAAEKLCHFISQNMPEGTGQAYYAECKELITAVKTTDLIAKILSQKSLILNLENERDAEGCFEGLFSLTYVLGDTNVDTPAIIRSIIASLTADITTKPKLTLQALTSLFNLTFSGDTKYEVLIAIFPFARATGQSDQVVHLHANYEAWVNAWSLGVEQQRALLKELFLVLHATKGSSQSLTTMIKFFNTFKGTASYPKDVEELICTSLIDAIKSPISSFGDRVSLLESLNTKVFAEPLSSLATLLRIVCDGSLDDFNAFCKGNDAVFAKHGLSKETLEHSMRLLALCSLAASSPDKVVSFDAVKKVLSCADDAEVESWVIEAISENLLTATIDQVNGNINITHFARRSFGANDWKALQQQLQVLRKNVAICVESINNTKSPVM